jgi:transcriptional regulator with XRE-family HTH domain
VLPRSVRVSSRNRIPERLETIGDHILRRRLSLKLLQKRVAQQLGAKLSTVRSWEANCAEPMVEFIPAIIRFLGHNPLPPGRSWAERLVLGRTALGLSEKESAKQIGVDPGTLARWERAECEPSGALAKRAIRILTIGQPMSSPAARPV